MSERYCANVVAGIKGLMDQRQASGDARTDGLRLRQLLLLCFGGAAALSASSERLNRHRKQRPKQLPAPAGPR